MSFANTDPIHAPRKDHLQKKTKKHQKYTLPETDIAPENRPSQKETSIPTIHF